MKRIETSEAPKAIGPYSQAVVAGGFVFCSGQLGLDPATGLLVAQDAPAQARQALANLSSVLNNAGSGLALVVKTTLFLADMNDFAAVNAVYEQAFGSHKPARSTVEVKRLPKDGRVEIECMAVV